MDRRRAIGLRGSGLKNSIVEAVYGLVDLFIPATCCLCKALLIEDERAICRECMQRLEYLEQPVCEVCGHPVAGVKRCMSCSAQGDINIKIRSVLAFAGLGKEAVIALKLGGKTYLATMFARMIAACRLQDIELRHYDVLVPVPLHQDRLRRRGFNQASLIASALSELAGLQSIDKNLRKHRKTVAQHALADRKKRRSNLMGSFKTTRKEAFFKKRCCLIDDVVTTGSTLAACADALYQAGAATVDAVTVARTLIR